MRAVKNLLCCEPAEAEQKTAGSSEHVSSAVWLVIAGRQLVLVFWPGLLPPICYVPHAALSLTRHVAPPVISYNALLRFGWRLGWTGLVGADKIGGVSSALGIGHTHRDLKLEKSRKRRRAFNQAK